MNTEVTYDLQECIGVCRQCHDVCVQTLSYCLERGGRHAEPAHIRLLFDCIDICEASVAFMLRDSDLHHATCAACAEVCEWCATDCEKMADDDRMRTCAEICRACARICREMAGRHAMAPAVQPAHEEIAALAETLYENDGRPVGGHQERWFRAERILQRRHETQRRGEPAAMKLRQVMTENVEVVHPDAPVREAAEIMRSRDVGALPVAADDHLVGMITDRDIAIRATASGRAPNDVKVREAMTPDLVYCFDDQDVHEAEDLMQEKQIRRLPILSREKRLVGIVSLGDLALKTSADEQNDIAVTLETISQAPPGGRVREPA
jgi:CBS domain-containing protein